jgi:ribosomal-protein-alanine N-acetyltransferase
MASASHEMPRALATHRLALRPFAPSDRERLFAIFRDPYVRRYLWDSELVSRARVDDVIAASERSFRERGLGVWCVAECAAGERGETIGFAGARPMASGELELIYGFLPEHWGRGFAREVARAVLRECFTRGHSRVWAGTDVENKASERVMQRLGMRLAKREVVHGLPQVYYSIERADFSA